MFLTEKVNSGLRCPTCGTAILRGKTTRYDTDFGVERCLVCESYLERDSDW